MTTEMKYPKTLTLYGCKESVARQLYIKLTQGPSYNFEELTDFICTNLIGCVELDGLTTQFYSKHQQIVKRMLKESADIASEFDSYDDFKAAIEEDAYDNEFFRFSDYDAKILIRARDKGFRFDWKIVHRFGWDILYLYARSTYRPCQIHKIDTRSPYRQTAEKMCAIGFSVQGEAIPIAEILDCVTTDSLKKMLDGSDFKKSWKKSQLINYLLALPDVRHLIESVQPVADHFKFSPLPEDVSEESVDSAVAYWEFCKQMNSYITALCVAASEPPVFNWTDKVNEAVPAYY
jgi:hypothetical protein